MNHITIVMNIHKILELHKAYSLKNDNNNIVINLLIKTEYDYVNYVFVRNQIMNDISNNPTIMTNTNNNNSIILVNNKNIICVCNSNNTIKK